MFGYGRDQQILPVHKKKRNPDFAKSGRNRTCRASVERERRRAALRGSLACDATARERVPAQQAAGGSTMEHRWPVGSVQVVGHRPSRHDRLGEHGGERGEDG